MLSLQERKNSRNFECFHIRRCNLEITYEKSHLLHRAKHATASTQVTSRLEQAYKDMHDKFDVVFISRDENQADFDNSYQTMPWKALPFDGNVLCSSTVFRCSFLTMSDIEKWSSIYFDLPQYSKQMWDIWMFRVLKGETPKGSWEW